MNKIFPSAVYIAYVRTSACNYYLVVRVGRKRRGGGGGLSSPCLFPEGIRPRSRRSPVAAWGQPTKVGGGETQTVKKILETCKKKIFWPKANYKDVVGWESRDDAEEDDKEDSPAAIFLLGNLLPSNAWLHVRCDVMKFRSDEVSFSSERKGMITYSSRKLIPNNKDMDVQSN